MRHSFMEVGCLEWLPRTAGDTQEVVVVHLLDIFVPFALCSGCPSPGNLIITILPRACSHQNSALLLHQVKTKPGEAQPTTIQLGNQTGR